jgi:hypothetical protein
LSRLGVSSVPEPASFGLSTSGTSVRSYSLPFHSPGVTQGPNRVHGVVRTDSEVVHCMVQSSYSRPSHLTSCCNLFFGLGSLAEKRMHLGREDGQLLITDSILPVEFISCPFPARRISFSKTVGRVCVSRLAPHSHAGILPVAKASLF